MSSDRQIPQGTTPRATLIGLALAGTGTLILPVGDAISKHLSGEGIPVLQIAWGRWISQILLLTPLLLLVLGPRAMLMKDVWLHGFRASLLVIATVAYFAALRTIPLADAAAILFIAPIIVTALSGTMLGERVGPWRWSAVIVGFVGVLLIVGPSGAGAGMGSLLALTAAVCFAFYFLLTRKLRGRNTPLATLWFMGVVGTVMMTPLAAWTWQPVDLTNAWLLLAIGIVMALGHLLVIQGMEHAEASAMAPVPYLEMVTATAIGLWWFGDFPSLATWAGCGIVVVAGLVIAWREGRGNVSGLENRQDRPVNLNFENYPQMLEFAASGRNTADGVVQLARKVDNPLRNERGAVMKIVLYIAAVLLILTGVIAAAVSLSPLGDSLGGFGLTVGTGATLLTGGCIVLALASLVGAINGLTAATLPQAVLDSADAGDDLPAYMELSPPAKRDESIPTVPVTANEAGSDDRTAQFAEDGHDDHEAHPQEDDSIREPEFVSNEAVSMEAPANENEAHAADEHREADEGREEAAAEEPVLEEKAADAVEPQPDSAATEPAYEATPEDEAYSAGPPPPPLREETVSDRLAATARNETPTIDSILSRRGENVGANTGQPSVPPPPGPSRQPPPPPSFAPPPARDVPPPPLSSSRQPPSFLEPLAPKMENVARPSSGLDLGANRRSILTGGNVTGLTPPPPPDRQPPGPGLSTGAGSIGQPPPPPPAVNSNPGELYVSEERAVRGRQCRFLSDGTVEAETDEGWMRFENLDHLNEYLDAMTG